MARFATVADDCVQRIAVCDEAEPLVDLAQASTPGMHLDGSALNEAHLGYPPRFLLRAEVARQLRQVPAGLPPGVHLLVKECYRPLAVQQGYFERYLRKVVAAHPDLDPAACWQLAARFVAPPDCATHVTGGAIDITLTDEAGHELDLGTAYDAAPETCGNACFTDAPGLPQASAELRQALVDAMTQAGFVNYPYEWWHWSFGDKYWAYVAGRPAAIYGPVQPAD